MTSARPTPNAPTRRRLAACRLALLLLVAATGFGCRTFDDARVLQALNQRGFGRKYVGDSNEVLTIGIGDAVTWADPANPLVPPGQAEVRMDGVITAPMIGEVAVAGFTTHEIEQALNQRYQEFFKDVHVQVQPAVVKSKFYFMKGEVQGARQFLGNTTVWDAVMSAPIPATADLDDIYVIRADPRHPLIIPVDLEKMLENGDSSDNVLIREDDIIVVNPNFAGLVRNGVLLLLQPIQPILLLGISVRNIQTIADSFQNDNNFYVGRGGYGGGYGGGGNAGLVNYEENGDASTAPSGGNSQKPPRRPSGDR